MQELVLRQEFDTKWRDPEEDPAEVGCRAIKRLKVDTLDHHNKPTSKSTSGSKKRPVKYYHHAMKLKSIFGGSTQSPKPANNMPQSNAPKKGKKTVAH